MTLDDIFNHLNQLPLAKQFLEGYCLCNIDSVRQAPASGQRPSEGFVILIAEHYGLVEMSNGEWLGRELILEGCIPEETAANLRLASSSKCQRLPMAT